MSLTSQCQRVARTQRALAVAREWAAAWWAALSRQATTLCCQSWAETTRITSLSPRRCVVILFVCHQKCLSWHFALSCQLIEMVRASVGNIDAFNSTNFSYRLSSSVIVINCSIFLFWSCVCFQLQTTIREHRDHGVAGGVFSRYEILKVGWLASNDCLGLHPILQLCAGSDLKLRTVLIAGGVEHWR